MKKRDLLAESIADAKLIKETAIKTAEASIKENLAPHLQKMFSEKIEEMDSEEDEELNLDELLAELEDSPLEEELEDSPLEEKTKPKEEDKPKDQEWHGSEGLEEIEGETEETEEGEEIDLENMDTNDLKELVKTAVEELVADGEISLDSIEGEEKEEVEESTEDEDEDIDIDELLAEVKKEKEVKEGKKAKMKKSEVEEVLVKNSILENKLAKSTLLNSQLLYANKIFVSHQLNESQKSKVIDALDKAKNIKEAKTIYESLMSVLKKKDKKVKPIMGSASKVIVTEHKKPIIETDQSVLRAQRLAGLI